MIILRNKSTKLRTFVIPPEIGGGQAMHVAAVDRISDAQTRSGRREVRAEGRVFPTTLTLTARGTKGSISDPVPDNYERAPEIAQAIRAGILEKQTVPAPPRGATTSAPTGEEA